MVNEWAGRNQEGWVDGEGIYGISLAHHQQALQRVSVALQMLAEFLFDTASLGGWERAQFSFKEKNEWRFGKYYWPSHCRIWCISSETFRGPRELFIKYRLATRMTNRYRGTLLKDCFYFLLWWASLELFWPEFQALATWWSQLNEVSVCSRVSIMVSIEATQCMRFMIPHVKLNSEL